MNDYSTFMLSWSVKNTNNSAVLHAINTRLALIDCAWKCTCYTWNSQSWTHEKVVKQCTPYIGNGILFALFAFLSCPALTYRKFNTRIFNEWLTQRELSIGLQNFYVHKLLDVKSITVAWELNDKLAVLINCSMKTGLLWTPEMSMMVCFMSTLMYIYV